MCGRFTLAERLEQLQARYDVQSVSQDYTPDYQAYNIAPTQQIPIVRMNTRVEPKKELITAKWAFSIGSNVVINSRDDRILTSKIYSEALETARCLIPANGFYEWKTVDEKKQPYLFKTTDQEIYSFAGFYQVMPITVDYRLGCSIITTKPNKLVEKVHDRMPAILLVENEKTWLDQETTKRELMDCLVPYPVERMISYPVTKKVNSVKNSSPDMVNEKKPLVKKGFNNFF